MKENLCINLTRQDGEEVKEARRRIRASAICLANCNEDCPKSRAKFRITELCFRIRKTQIKPEENLG